MGIWQSLEPYDFHPHIKKNTSSSYTKKCLFLACGQPIFFLYMSTSKHSTTQMKLKQTLKLFIKRQLRSFSSQSSKHCLSQTVRAREMNILENPPPPPTMCHMSHIMCHVNISCVTCHVSHVTCHVFLFFFGQSGGASQIRVCAVCGSVPFFLLLL